MTTIFIEVITPGNGKTYEFQIDSAMSISQAKLKIIDEINELENGNITLRPEKTMLCNLNTRIQLNELDSLKAVGVKSGHCLLLI